MFSPDGKLLYATENDFETARGVIGVFDVAGGYKRIGEFDTYRRRAARDPADARWQNLCRGQWRDRDPSRLWPAGAQHRDDGSLALFHRSRERRAASASCGSTPGCISCRSGTWRWMRATACGSAASSAGDAAIAPQLVGYATLDGDIRLIELPTDTLRDLRNYVGSVAASADGSLIAVSSPEGDTILAIDAASAEDLHAAGAQEWLRHCAGPNGLRGFERAGRCGGACRLIGAGEQVRFRFRQPSAAAAGLAYCSTGPVDSRSTISTGQSS